MTGGTVQMWASIRATLRHLAAFAPQAEVLSYVPDATQFSLRYGTGSGTASLFCAMTRTLAAGQSETLDLFDGSLTGSFGEPANFRVLRAYAVWVSGGGDSAGLTVGGAGSNPTPLFWGGTNPTKTVYPNGLADTGGGPGGTAITATARNLKFLNNSAVPLTYTLVLAGSPAATGVPIGLLLALTYP